MSEFENTIPEFNPEDSGAPLEDTLDAYLSINPDDIPESNLLPPATYELRVQKVVPKAGKSGFPYVNVMLIADGYDAPPIYHTLFLFRSDAKEADKAAALRKINQFCTCCGAEGATLAEKLRNCVGKRVSASVGINQPKNSAYSPTNEVKALLPPVV